MVNKNQNESRRHCPSLNCIYNKEINFGSKGIGTPWRLGRVPEWSVFHHSRSDDETWNRLRIRGRYLGCLHHSLVLSIFKGYGQLSAK